MKNMKQTQTLILTTTHHTNGRNFFLKNKIKLVLSLSSPPSSSMPSTPPSLWLQGDTTPQLQIARENTSYMLPWASPLLQPHGNSLIFVYSPCNHRFFVKEAWYDLLHGMVKILHELNVHTYSNSCSENPVWHLSVSVQRGLFFRVQRAAYTDAAATIDGQLVTKEYCIKANSAKKNTKCFICILFINYQLWASIPLW